jgi:nucleotide-binding universal stress UspA family protein
MFKTALVAVDFAASSRPMIERLAYLSKLGVERAILVHVKPTANKQRSPSRDELAEELEAHAELLRRHVPDVETRLLSGEPISQLLTVATDDRIDLLATGSRAHHPAKRLLMGSTAAGVVRQATVPVLLEDVRDADGGKEELPRRDGPVMLATDGSSAAEAAERIALKIAGEGPLRIVTVTSGTDVGRAWGRLERVTKLAEKAGVRVVRSVDLGRAEQVIPQIAAAERVSLIVTGRRGREGVTGVRLGSTAETICRNANRPVLLIPGIEQR